MKNRVTGNVNQGRRSAKRLMAAGLAAVMTLGFAACGHAGKGQYAATMPLQNSGLSYEFAEYGYDYPMADGFAENVSAGGAAASDVSAGTARKVDNSAYFDERKLIRTVDLDVETKEFDGMLAAIEEQVDLLGGYIESMNTYNGSRYSYGNSNRNSSLTVRIPKNQLNDFLDVVSEAGNIVRRSEDVQDVTLTYVDLESRKKSLETEQERLQELLGMAESLEDVLTIEDRLSTVRYQLESMGAQLRTYDNKVDFSTVYMSIREVKELTPVEEETAWERMTGGFMDSVRDVKDGFVDFFIWIVVHVPYLAIWAAVIFIIVMIVKLLIRRGRRKRAEKLRKQTSAQSEAGANPQGAQPEVSE